MINIYPTADVLPENLLKFYLLFSQPMSGGGIYEYIHLVEAGGKKVELPFLQIDEELWNREMTRLTLFLDPGRIKRGVRPLEEIGPALQAGGSYILRIDSAWPDARGAPLTAAFEKKFTVSSVEREPINPGTWKIEAPQTTGTLDLLRVTFGKPLDHALVLRMIQIVRKNGGAVPGRVELHPYEQGLDFHPAEPWKEGIYAVLVQNTIEDLAGNNIGKPFEVDLEQAEQSRFLNSVTRLPFAVGSPAAGGE